MTLPDSIVIDASVVLNWLLAESHAAQASALLADASRELVAPPHLRTEVANAVYRRSLRTTDLAITREEAERALDALTTLDLTVQEPDYQQVLATAYRFELRTIYDAAYVVLARTIGCEFWTADQRLVRSLGSAAPWVRFIGEFNV